MRNCYFFNHTSISVAGSIYNYNTNITFDNTTIVNSYSGTNGGFIYIDNLINEPLLYDSYPILNVNILNGMYAYNLQANSFGGFFFVYSRRVRIDILPGLYVNNLSALSSGCFYLYSFDYLRINRAVFTNIKV